MQLSPTLWPGITNQHAKEMVEALFNTPCAHTDQGDFEHYCEKLPAGLKGYQAWVRAELERSNLAQRLAAGLDWLPDFAKELPAPLDFLFKFVQPRTLKDAAPHLIIFLEWYADPRHAAPIARRAIVYGVLASILLVRALTVMCLVNIIDTLILVMIMVFSGVASASFRFLVSLLTQGVSDPAKRSVNATELYWYFRREFSETNDLAYDHHTKV